MGTSTPWDISVRGQVQTCHAAVCPTLGDGNSEEGRGPQLYQGARGGPMWTPPVPTPILRDRLHPLLLFFKSLIYQQIFLKLGALFFQALYSCFLKVPFCGVSFAHCSVSQFSFWL